MKDRTQVIVRPFAAALFAAGAVLFAAEGAAFLAVIFGCVAITWLYFAVQLFRQRRDGRPS